MNSIRVLYMLFLISILSAPASANSVLNTGTPDEDVAVFAAFTDEQFFAARFTLDAPLLINSIEFYFRNKATRGNVEISIVNNLGDTPLYSGTFTTLWSRYHSWQGLAGLNWALDTGSYWVAFLPDWGVAGSIPLYAAPDPFENYAQTGRTDWSRVFFYNHAFGVRINAPASEVPIPASLPLLGAALVLLSGFGVRRYAVLTIRQD